MPTKPREKQPAIDSLYPIALAARALDVSPTTLDSAIRAGKCECYRLATGQAVVTLDQVRTWLATDRKRGRRAQAE